MKKLMKSLSIFLCVCMLVLMAPFRVSAAEDEFTVSFDYMKKTATITAYNGRMQSEIIIPNTFTNYDEEYQVTAIGAYVFQNQWSITAITIPDTVTSIGERAFEDCRNLKAVKIPDRVSEIKTAAFQNCYALESVTLPANLGSIGDSAFSGCKVLTEITIPKWTNSISDTAFLNCEKLEQIYAESDSYYYKSLDGVLFNYNSAKLIKYPEGKAAETYRIPNGVSAINQNAFYNCTKLKSIDFPKSVVSVGESAYAYCSLTDIYYGGSADNWKDISIHAKGNDALANAARHDTYTVMLNTNDGTVNSGNLSAYTNGRAATLPEDVTKSGFAFGGWYEDPAFTGSPVQEIPADSKGNRTFYAKWLVPYTYRISEGEVEILNGNPEVTGKLQIPALIESLPVTTIAAGAFENCARLESIELPQSIKIIAENAFLGCRAFSNVYYNGSEADWSNVSVAAAGNDVFSAAAKHFGFTVTLKAKGGYINSGYIGSYISGTVTKLPTDVTRDGYFFEGWYTQPDYAGTPVTEISANASGNKTYYARWNDTYQYTHGAFDYITITGVINPEALTGDWVIPDTLGGGPVYAIGQGAFQDCTNITSVTLSKMVTSVKDDAFKNCTNMISFKTVWNSYDSLYVAETAFTGCSALRDIYYGGSNRSTSWNLAYKGPMDGITAHEPYFLTFEANGGTIGSDALRFYPSGVVTKLPADVTKEGFKFGGWYEDENFEGERQDEIPAEMTGAKTYYAKWINTYLFQVDEDDGATITGVLFPDDFIGNVTLPGSVGGYPVVAIGDGAFSDCQDMIRVTVPGGVVSISDSAFRECMNLREISIPKTVKSIGDRAFLNCRRLEQITVDPQNANYRSSDGILFDKTGNTLLCYPQKKSAEAFTIPNTVTAVGKSAFENCGNLKTITIPSSVTLIEGNAFGNCRNLSALELAGDNASYLVDSGVLFDKTGKSLLCYPAGRNAAQFEIPSGVATVGGHAFYGCSALMELTIPVTVGLVESGAFEECSRLADVYYGGDDTAWSDMMILDKNTPLMNAVKHYTFSVTLHAGKGVVNEPVLASYVSGIVTLLPSDVTRPGFSFQGWYDNEACNGTAVTAISSDATGEKMFWAKWQADTILPDMIEVTSYTDGAVTIVSPIRFENVCVVFASYHKGIMTSCEFVELSVEAGEQQVTAENFSPAAEDEIRIMLWNSLADMCPLSKVFVMK